METPPSANVPLRLVPPEIKPKPGEDPELAVLDHVFIGGRLTVCVLGFADHLELMQRCLGSILNHTPAHRLVIRVALNQPSKRLLSYVQGFSQDVITKIYIDIENRRKYPAMREMFWDAEHPITTKYVLWFDDDSHVIDKKWLVLLGREIVANHTQKCHMYGTKYVHDLMIYKRQGFNPEKWFHAAPWWKNVWLRLANGTREASNGSQILFVTGGFWAISLEAIRAADIPDKRLSHSGGDVVLGCQIHQAGYKIKDFCRNKTPVRWSDSPRRGVTESFLWGKQL